MKKNLKLLTIVSALIVAVSFTTCKQFREDPEDFLSYWSSEVVPIDFSIDEPYQMSNDGALCIPSSDPVTLTIKLRNPKNFTIVTPAAAADAGKVIYFPGLSPQPVYGTDYTLQQTAIDTLELKYETAFLQAHEWSNGGIGPEITLISTDGRKFSKKFSLNIEANTPPPDIGDIKIAKTEGYYALCFDETGGMTPMLNGKRLHKDIKAIHIQKEGGSEETIPLTVKDDGSGFDIPSTLPVGLLSSVDQLFDTPPGPGSWTVYVKTYTELAADGALPKKYKVWLTDKKGLSSAPKEAETLGSIPDISDADTAWKNLKKAVEKASQNGVIIVMGNVTATKDLGNSGQIEISKNLTIMGKKEDGSDTLDANSDTGGKAAHRIFKITGAVQVQMKNLTLKNGKETTVASTSGSGGGGILMEGKANLTLTGVTIRDCTSKGSGGGLLMHPVYGDYDGKLTMKNSKIIYNTVKDDGFARDSSAGGIALPNISPYTAVIEDCEISHNKVDVSEKAASQPIIIRACGLYTGNTSNSKTYIKGHTVIEGNGYVKHASKTTNVQGIGMWMQGGEVTIGETGKSDAESPLIQNHQFGDANTVKGTAIYLERGAIVHWMSGQIINNGGPTNAVFETTGAAFDNQTTHTAN